MKQVVKMCALGMLALFAALATTAYVYRENDTELVDIMVARSVVRLKGGGSVATGFAINHKGYKYVLTNNHVCEGLTELQAERLGTFSNLTVLYKEEKTDLCLLTPVENMIPLVFYPFSKVYAKNFKSLGHPFGFEQVISTGRFVQTQIMETAAPFPPDQCPHKATEFKNVENQAFRMLMLITGLKSLCLDIAIMNMYNMITVPGNSGSPVYDGFGYVHGIISQTMSGLFGIAVSNMEIQGFLNRYEKSL